jgi:hypothetical protein
VPSSASTQARRCAPGPWGLRAVTVAPGALRARLAMDAIPVVAGTPPLGGDGVARQSVAPGAPLGAAGVSPASVRVWRPPTSAPPWGLLPVCRWSRPTPGVEARLGSPEFPARPG